MITRALHSPHQSHRRFLSRDQSAAPLPGAKVRSWLPHSPSAPPGLGWTFCPRFAEVEGQQCGPEVTPPSGATAEPRPTRCALLPPRGAPGAEHWWRPARCNAQGVSSLSCKPHARDDEPATRRGEGVGLGPSSPEGPRALRLSASAGRSPSPPRWEAGSTHATRRVWEATWEPRGEASRRDPATPGPGGDLHSEASIRKAGAGGRRVQRLRSIFLLMSQLPRPGGREAGFHSPCQDFHRPKLKLLASEAGFLVRRVERGVARGVVLGGG